MVDAQHCGCCYSGFDSRPTPCNCFSRKSMFCNRFSRFVTVFHDPVAQWTERQSSELDVVGSSPIGVTFLCLMM